jgi:hypothetical protein
MKRYAIGAVVGGLVLVLLGYVIYVLLVPDPEFARGPNAALLGAMTPNLPPIIIGEILLGFLLTRGLIKSGAISSPGASAQTGALIGTVAGLAFGLIMAGAAGLMSIPGAVWEGVTWGIRWAIAAAVLSMILGKMKD